MVEEIYFLSNFLQMLRNNQSSITTGKLEFIWGVDRHGIAPTRICTHIFKNIINIFVCIKLIYLFKFPFSSINNRNKTLPRRPRIQFKESGCNSVWVQYQVNRGVPYQAYPRSMQLSHIFAFFNPFEALLELLYTYFYF